MQFKTTNIGYPVSGRDYELRTAVNRFLNKKITEDELAGIKETIKQQILDDHLKAGIDIIPSNIFTMYDRLYDHAHMLGFDGSVKDYSRYFKAAKECNMTRWFSTNCYSLAPKIKKVKKGENIVLEDYLYYKNKYKIETMPVILGPVIVSEKLRLNLEDVLCVYMNILHELTEAGCSMAYFEEPGTVSNQSEFYKVYNAFMEIAGLRKGIHLSFCSARADCLEFPADFLGIDCLNDQWTALLLKTNKKLNLAIGIVDGRGIVSAASHDYVINLLHAIKDIASNEEILLHPNYSLEYLPNKLDIETKGIIIKGATAFDRLKELAEIKKLANEKLLE